MHLEFYKETHGSIPEEEVTNRVITKLWTEKDYRSSEFDDPSEDELAMIIGGADYRSLKLWGKPPKYIVSKDLPGGYGLYMEGEDGVTRSNGNDPDDLNSWDVNSRSFYIERSEREHKPKRIIYMLCSVGASLLAFIVCNSIWRKK